MMSAIKSGTLINNRYEIQKLLGQGGFGRTYLAFDTQRFGEACVLKEFLPATSETAIWRKSRELFQREARVLYQIEHPQIPKFLALLIDDERLFIVQEYINGKNYAQILYERLAKKGKPFSESEAKVWLLNMLPVLEYIHERKIIHRDISLENVMLPHQQSQPMLIDFGVVSANFTNQNSLICGSVVGKIGYSPPEQLRLGKCYPSSDIYALGVCTIILLTGKMPSLLMDNSLHWQWRSHVNVSGSFASILDKMLAEKSSDRYQSAKEVIAELNGQISTSYTPPNNITQPEQPDIENFTILEESKQKPEAEKVTRLTPVAVNQEFLEYCQRELTSFVGPLASILIKHTLKRHPEIAPKEFIEVLTAALPDAKVADKFRNCLKIPGNYQSQNPSIPPKPQELLGNFPAISDPEFLEKCRRELNSFVGPFGSVILKDTLDQSPHLTAHQLIETLVAEIPNPQRAEQFRERILKPKVN